MVVLRNLPLPFGEPIAKAPRPGYKPGEDPQAGFMTLAWINSLTANQNQLDSMPVKVAAFSLTDQSAGIAATDMTDGKINTGQYRLSYWIGVTTAAAVNSTLRLDIDYEYRGVTKVLSGTDLAANSTAEVDDRVRFLTVDGNTPVRYTVDYSTGFGAPMQYDVFLSLENVPQ